MNWVQKYAIAIPAGLVYTFLAYLVLSFIGGFAMGLAGYTDTYQWNTIWPVVNVIILVLSIIFWIPITWYIAKFLTKETMATIKNIETTS